MAIESATSGVPAKDFWRDRRVLLTGATGIIGSWLAKLLIAAGADVTVLIFDSDWRSELFRSRDIERVKVVQGGVEDFRTLERAINENEIRTVYHLAAQTIVGTAHRSPYSTFETNIRGTYNLLEACRLHKDVIEQIVVASSDKAYGEQPALPYTEESALGGRFPYEVSKSCADLIAQSYFHTYDLPVTVSRCGNVYGGGDLNWSRIVPATIRSLLRDQRPIIRSDGTFVRDYIYVKDVAQGYMLLAERFDNAAVRGQAFNFSAESPRSVLDLVKLIQSVMKAEDMAPEIQDRAEGEIRDQHLSAARAREVLGWKPEYSIERGLGETIEWYRALLLN